jgi:Lrp/AsnC family transcriptional regulator
LSDALTVDAADLKLLALMQEDATLSIGELGERINLSQNACWRRIRRLEEQCYILKRVALLDPSKLGAGVTVFVTVQAAEHSEQWLSEFAAAVRKLPEVVEFYRMSGEVDYLLKLQVADIAAYDAVYQKLIRSVRLSKVSSAFAMEEIKHTTCIPLPRQHSSAALAISPRRPR